MNPTTQSPTNTVHPARQQRIFRLLEVKAKTGFGRSTIYALMANDLEGTALAHNDALLALDEMGEVDPKEAGDVAYMLANGQGKTCAGKYGEMRLPARWRLVFLSTGEVTLESHLASIGKRVKAGQQVRVIALSADAGAQMGVLNHSHGMNAADLADHLKQQSRQHYGCLALDWLRYLTQHSARVGLILLVHKPSTCFTQPAGVKPPKA